MSRAQLLAGATGLILLATGAAGWALIHAPWQQERRRLQGLLQTEAERGDLLETLQSKGSELEEAQDRWLLEGGTPVLTRQVTELATRYGINIESVVPKEETRFGPYARHEIELLANVGFQNLLFFLHALEEHQPRFIVNQMELLEEAAPPPDPRLPFQEIAKQTPKETGTLLERMRQPQQQVRIRIAAFGAEPAAP